MKIINIDVLDNIKFRNIEDLETGLTKFIDSNLNIPTDNVNNVILNFNFITPDAIDRGLRLFVIFSGENIDKPILVELTELEIEGQSYNRACRLPSETLLKQGIVSMGVYGYMLNDDETINNRVSLRPISYNVVKGSYDEDTTIAIVPTPTVFETYFNEVANVNDEMLKNLEQYINDLEEAKTRFNVDEINNNISTLFNNIKTINGNITDLNNEDTTIKDDINEFENNVYTKEESNSKFNSSSRLEDGSNIDNITTKGTYSIFNATGTLPSGYSTTDNNIFIRCLVWATDYIIQEFYDIRSTSFYIRNKLDGVWGEWLKLSGEVVLYDNSSGSNGTINLTDNLRKYRYVDIYYQSNDATPVTNVTRVKGSSIRAMLSVGLTAGDGKGGYIKTRMVDISDTAITTAGSRYNEINWLSTGNTIVVTNYVYITKVIAYR